MSHEVKKLSVEIPYKTAGNQIRQHPVTFDVYKDTDGYRAVPCLTDEERRIANLPEELVFSIEHGKARSARGARDGNFHVIEDLAKKLLEE